MVKEKADHESGSIQAARLELLWRSSLGGNSLFARRLKLRRLKMREGFPTFSVCLFHHLSSSSKAITVPIKNIVVTITRR
jgi:hypothetical protein